MNEPMELIPEERNPQITERLQTLRVLTIIGLVLSWLSLLNFLSAMITWISHIVSVIFIYSLYTLAPVNRRYRNAAILLGVNLAGNILTAWVDLGLLGIAMSVCGVVAAYQELYGHAELVQDRQADLAQNWRSLFTWNLVVGIITGVLSVAGVIIAVLANVTTETVVLVTLLFTAGVSTVMSAFYLKYMKRTMALFE